MVRRLADVLRRVKYLTGYKIPKNNFTRLISHTVSRYKGVKDMFTLMKDNKVKYIMTSTKLYNFCHEMALKEDRDKLEDCIEWSESYPILKDIAGGLGYELKDVGEIITVG